jgi:hypothetical protein
MAQGGVITVTVNLMECGRVRSMLGLEAVVAKKLHDAGIPVDPDLTVRQGRLTWVQDPQTKTAIYTWSAK